MVKIDIIPHQLQFIKSAKTSRNVFKTRQVYFLKIYHPSNPNIYGLGEAAPLELLSIDDRPDYYEKLKFICSEIESGSKPEDLDLEPFPSIKFGLETAFNDLQNGGIQKIISNNFYEGKPIEINGLIWMNDSETMLEEALQKGQKFGTIKFKVGALDFDEECRMLESFRKQFPSNKTQIRLDANGAFEVDDAIEKLTELNRFTIHSIEQPIKAGQWDAMEYVAKGSPIDVALDEELIGVNIHTQGSQMVKKIKAEYLILKPNLIGGLKNSDQWLQLANKNEMNWWATSALESNVGLNAISQWASSHNNPLPQGLGTGSLFSNNINSPLEVKDGFLHYNRNLRWDSF